MQGQVGRSQPQEAEGEQEVGSGGRSTVNISELKRVLFVRSRVA